MRAGNVAGDVGTVQTVSSFLCIFGLLMSSPALDRSRMDLYPAFLPSTIYHVLAAVEA